VLLLSHSAALGGAERSLAEGVEALVRRGHEVCVVLPKNGPLEGHLGAASDVLFASHNGWIDDPTKARVRARLMAYNALVAAPEVAALAEQNSADLVVSNSIGSVTGGLAAKLSGLPHVWFFHEFGTWDHGGRFFLGPKLSYRLMRWLAPVCLANSQATLEHFQARLPGVTLRRIRYAVETPQQPAPSNFTSHLFRMILLGGRVPSKGQAQAVAALGLLASARVDTVLHLVGRGDPSYETELKALAAKLGVADRLRLLPFHPEPFQLLSESDVALMCSRSEAFGRVTIEAMKSGTPVVGAASGATPELIRHGWNGYLYRPGDPADLARWLKILYEDRELLAQMGRRARNWAYENYNLTAHGEDLEQALALALSRAGDSPKGHRLLTKWSSTAARIRAARKTRSTTGRT
jgi:glycosyltransferase involved in cell wall biosynthesis